ncbi:tetratricopeptide repeat protein [Dethiobacter alkaliphilus]|uniref:TPR repeat-containing protein n=1 Tax=Dethiobacter alkaliphilus AHT 1 TaxID=555088 RepID=C0GC40_DETAL|nr:tetratricopeptide repeat protein [Dethiobacter alkaliphilus]EEG78775.1 TPR repeat-containing protein [Dethiobacter alkaliphilus AHT 1]
MGKKKSAIRRLDKKMVKIVVILAAAGMLFSVVAIGLAGGFMTPPAARGNLAGTIEDLEFQIRQYENSLESSPDNAALWTQLGNSYYQLALVYSEMDDAEKTAENFANAIEPYGKALEIEPDDVNVRVDRAVSAFYSDSYDLAEEQFEKAIETDPTHVQARYNYGIFQYFGRNNATAAIEQWNEVLELNPSDQQQLVANARGFIAQAEAEMNQLIGDPSQFEENSTEDEADAQTDDEETTEDDETEEN